MKKFSILIIMALLFNVLPVLAEDTVADSANTEVYDAEIISAEIYEAPALEPTPKPDIITDIPAIIEGKAKTFKNPVIMKNNTIFVPLEEITKAFWFSYQYADGVHKAYSHIRSLTIDANNNAYIFNTLQTLEVSPETINGTLYVPVNLIVKAFNLDIIISTKDEKPELHLATSGRENTELNNAYVNSTGLGSDTHYFIWISKSDYKVRVFLGGKGQWNQIKSFTCGIGAPATPTCEGTYKYYQSHAMWDYGSYYVGPVMRFNGGYAIHSTLIYKNGTPKDNRVGIRLSLGCIRLRPDDINWLFYYAPLGTTIHITG